MFVISDSTRFGTFETLEEAERLLRELGFENSTDFPQKFMRQGDGFYDVDEVDIHQLVEPEPVEELLIRYKLGHVVISKDDKPIRAVGPCTMWHAGYYFLVNRYAISGSDFREGGYLPLDPSRSWPLEKDPSVTCCFAYNLPEGVTKITKMPFGGKE